MAWTCRYLARTGTPCGSCGLTRGWIALAHGHVTRARAYNPHAPSTFVAALTFVGGSIALFCARQRLSRERQLLIALVLVCVLVIGWSGVLARNIELGAFAG